MSPTVPPWADVATALLVVLGGVSALVGSIGLSRFRTFFQRVHAPTLAYTSATWSLTLATILQMSFVRDQVFVHPLVVAALLALTAPVTTIFLMRASLFRHRVEALDRPRE
jgi:multicomponent K+:H+ antiporter subunit G